MGPPQRPQCQGALSVATRCGKPEAALARAMVMAPGALGTTEAVHRGRERFAGADHGFFDRCGYRQVVQPL